MSTTTHRPVSPVTDRPHRLERVPVRELGASLAICSMWIAVLFSAVFGPDFVSTTTGGSTTTIPSAIAVALFAAIATRIVARYGFAEHDEDTDA